MPFEPTLYNRHGALIYWSPDPASQETIADTGVIHPLDGNVLVMFVMHRAMQSMNGLVLYLPAQGSPRPAPPCGAQEEQPMPQPPADFGTPTDGPIWTCVGVYEDGMQAAIFYVHAPHVGGVLDTIEGAIRAERVDHSFTTIAVFKGALEEAH